MGNRPATEQLTIWGSVDVWQSAHIKRVREIRRYFTLEPNRWFLATYRNQPAGVVGATNYGPFTYLGMMTVRKELQRKGIGQALLTGFPNRGFAVYDTSGVRPGIFLLRPRDWDHGWSACRGMRKHSFKPL